MSETAQQEGEGVDRQDRDAQVHCAHRSRLYRGGVLTASDLPLVELAEHFGEPDALIWVDLLAPTSADLQALAPLVGGEVELHPLAIENAAAGASDRGWCAIATTACCTPAPSTSIPAAERSCRHGWPPSFSIGH
ncbi:hypothetical protein P9209_27935 [Prescottella defluvii]|nr:hypothetical protein P9209_27935 [Prescottella defluvii]